MGRSAGLHTSSKPLRRTLRKLSTWPWQMRPIRPNGIVAFPPSLATPSTIPTHGDNKGAIDLALNPVTGRRSKHIDIKHHVIREYIEQDELSLIRTPTTEMVADGFTKP